MSIPVFPRLEKIVTKKCKCSNCGVVHRNFILPADAKQESVSIPESYNIIVFVEMTCPACGEKMRKYLSYRQSYNNSEDYDRDRVNKERIRVGLKPLEKYEYRAKLIIIGLAILFAVLVSLSFFNII